MTKPKPRPKSAAAAVTFAIERELERRSLKPIEIVKLAICAYQSYYSTVLQESEAAVRAESSDRAGIRRGTQSSVDRLLFNANYWLDAYENRIVHACSNADDAQALLKAIAVWNTHTLKLNTLTSKEVIETFERFCPPFATSGRLGSGRGPVPEFRRMASEIAERETPENAMQLHEIIDDMEAEARVYDELGATGSLDALFAVLPAWCMQDAISLVRGDWWNDADVMMTIANHMNAQFVRDGFGDAACRYFIDSYRESIDLYGRDISTEQNPYTARQIPELVTMVSTDREKHPAYETEGYETLPSWLISKEQLIWNTIVCAVYGPSSVRPLLAQELSEVVMGNYTESNDVITELAHASFARYTADRASSGTPSEYAAFSDQPEDLRRSSIEHIRSVPEKLKTLGYEVMPAGSCYPDQRVNALSTSEVECLAILEHRRWIAERKAAGWTYDLTKDVTLKTSPYLIPWEDLPERAREWNRSAARSIPALLASVGLAVVK